MKKSLVLGAAALATLVMAAPQAKAGEVKIGGYYMFRMQDADATVAKDAAGVDGIRGWQQRVQLNMDFIQDKATHAHMVVRALDGKIVQGADGSVTNGGTGGVSYASNAGATGAGPAGDANDWNIRKAWLETEAFGVGVKVGNMPIALNDNILVNNDDTGFGAIMLSKTFGDVTAVLADVKINEGNIGAQSSASTVPGFVGTSTNGFGSNSDDIDLYVVALLGKVNNINYGISGAYADIGKDSALVNVNPSFVAGALASSNDGVSLGKPGQSMDDGWLALTLNTVIGGVEITGTGIWETGMNGVNQNALSAPVGTAATIAGAAAATPAAGAVSGTADKSKIAAKRLDKSGGLAAVRLKGDLPNMAQGSAWNAYAMYSTEGFTPVTGRNPVWSKTWDMSGPGSQDLMRAWAAAAGTDPEANMMAVGAGLTFVPAVNWTINPMIDFAKVNKDDTLTAGKKDYRTSSAWGGGVEVAHKLNPATTVAVTGLYVDPNDNGNNTTFGGATATDKMHVIEATLKMTF